MPFEISKELGPGEVRTPSDSSAVAIADNARVKADRPPDCDNGRQYLGAHDLCYAIVARVIGKAKTHV